jgi:hypothetical protein
MAYIEEEIDTNKPEMKVSMKDVEQCLRNLNNGEAFTFVIDDQENELRPCREGDTRPNDILLIITPEWCEGVYCGDNWTPEVLQTELKFFAEQFAVISKRWLSTLYTVMWR